MMRTWKDDLRRQYSAAKRKQMKVRKKDNFKEKERIRISQRKKEATNKILKKENYFKRKKKKRIPKIK